MLALELNIDDIVAHKLTLPQIRVAFLLAYGKYTNKQIAKKCQVSVSSIYDWQRNDDYFQILMLHIKLMELYKNLEEYTELKKASIASTTMMLKQGLSGDIITFKKGLDALNKLLSIFN